MQPARVGGASFLFREASFSGEVSSPGEASFFFSQVNVLTERQTLRQQLRQTRRAIDAHEHAQRSAAISQQLVNHRVFRAAQHIGCYLPNDAEVDLGPLVRSACAMGKMVYLPVLSAIHHNRLHFLPYAPGDTLMANSFGIPEPVLRSRRVPELTRLDVVLTPLVGFDGQGNRLGMGGGFYDRTFAYLCRRQSWRKPHLLGVAFDVQKCAASLPHEHWDVPLEGVVTESGVQLFR